MLINFTPIIYSALGIQRAQYMSLKAVFLLKANTSLIDLLTIVVNLSITDFIAKLV